MGSFNKDYLNMTVGEMKKLNNSAIRLKKIKADQELTDKNLSDVIKGLKKRSRK